MKKIFQYLMMLTVSMMATSCYYDEMPPEPETPIPDVVSYSKDILKLDLINQHKDEIERAGIEVVIISFSYLAVRRVRRSGIIAAKVVRYGLGALISRSRVVAIKMATLKRYPSLIKVIKADRIYVWTVNSKEDLRWLNSREIFGVITDRPKRAHIVLRK